MRSHACHRVAWLDAPNLIKGHARVSDHIVIVGGGVIGSSIAYHVCTGGYAGPVTVIERDPSYRQASSFLAMGGIRQQFSSAANINLAQYSIRFYERFDTDLAVPEHQPHAHFRQRGYLFLVNRTMAEQFERRYVTQRGLGARIQRLDNEAIRTRVPDLVLDDIEFGLFGPDDGYADPREVLSGFRRAAIAAGATYRTANVTGLTTHGDRVWSVTVDTGARLEARAIICAAGPFAAQLAALTDIDLPVTPVRQQLFRCVLPRQWPHRFPMVIDPSGVHWRHDDSSEREGHDRIVVACTKLDEPVGENFACDMQRWETDFRPPLVARLPALEETKMLEGWAGLYEMTPDHNPVLGEYPKRSGFYVANGFSGHGLMMAPAVGAAIAELVTTGESTRLDIGPFDPERFSRGDLFWDDAMI